MATTRLKNSLYIIFVILVLIILSIYFIDKMQKNGINNGISSECDDQDLFKIPLVYINNIELKDTANINVSVRRNGKNRSDILTFVAYGKRGDSLSLMLSPNITDTSIALIKDQKEKDFQVQMLMDVSSIAKQDTIVITIRSTNYVIHGFGTQSFLGDHGYLRCSEFYEMNGKTYGSRAGNTINDQNTAN